MTTRLPSMRVALWPAETLQPLGAWAASLAQSIADSTSIEWNMRLQACVYRGEGPRPRFPNGVPIPRHQVGAGGSPWFSAADVASWLAAMGFVVTHEEAMQQAPQATSPDLADEDSAGASQDAAGCEADEEARAGDTRLPPVSTGDIASAFDGLKWCRRDWVQNLNKGDALAQWLERSLLVRGQPGRRDRPSKWDPLRIASSLVQDGIPAIPPGRCAPTRTQVAQMVRERFAKTPCLVPWHREWLSHEAFLREEAVIS